MEVLHGELKEMRPQAEQHQKEARGHNGVDLRQKPGPQKRQKTKGRWTLRGN